jgi:hypothetical protein
MEMVVSRDALLCSICILIFGPKNYRNFKCNLWTLIVFWEKIQENHKFGFRIVLSWYHAKFGIM